jgi:methionyl-tRNA formyltransferase
VKEAALAAGLHVYQPESIKSESSRDFLQRIAPDAVVIIAYGQIIPGRLLTIPRLGWINVHGSLLPRYRGAAPIHWAIANGETRTGVTTMQIDAGMDTGPVLLQRELAIGADETTPELYARMSQAGAHLIVESLLKFGSGEIAPISQNSAQATYAPILKKEDGRIGWSRAAQQIYNRMRGFAPWPGAFATFRGQTCRIWGRPGEPVADGRDAEPGEIVASATETLIRCGEGTCLRVEFIQMEGRKRVTAREFAIGARIDSTDRFI